MRSERTARQAAAARCWSPKRSARRRRSAGSGRASIRGWRWRSSWGPARRRCGRRCRWSPRRASPRISAAATIREHQRLVQAAVHWSLLPFNEPAPLEVQEMREHRSAGRHDQPRVEPGIGVGDDVRDVARLLAHQLAGSAARAASGGRSASAHIAAAWSPAARAPDNRCGRRAAAACRGSPCMSAMSPSGGTTTVVDQPITWSPVSSAPCVGEAQMIGGVPRRRDRDDRRCPSTSTASPSASTRSGA